MRLPDFLIIGAAKSGTTTLYKYLCQHPQIYMSEPKEPNFFADNKTYAKGLDWYASLFSQAESYQVCGEASTFYTLNLASELEQKLQPVPVSECAERIAQILPNVKLIYIMRNPIDRAYSHWVHYIRICQYVDLKQNSGKRYVTQEVESFEDSIRRQSQDLDNSNYMERIDQYLNFFPRESFLFLFMDDLIHETADTLRKVCNFLEIDDEIDLTKGESVWENENRSHFDNIIRSRITTPLKSIPGVSHAASLLPPRLRDSIYQGLRQLPTGKQIEQKYLPPPMLPETRKMLIERFREPNQKLAEFLNCDLSHWSK
jgi:hypothetical protein